MPAEDLQARLDELAKLGLEALVPMFDRASGLFCHKTVVGADGYSNRGANPLYSAMSLVGILSQSIAPAEGTVDLGRALDALHGVTVAGDRPDVAAVALWAMILAEDPRGRELARGLAARRDLERSDSATLGHVVHAMALAAEAYPQERDAALAASGLWAERLLGRFSEQADLFRPLGRPTGIRSALLQRVTSFAAQVYPLHGLASFHRVAASEPAPALRRAAERIVEAQGPLGQWWWLYSTQNRAILEGYPVYSVHQDGMAFMGLVPLEALGLGSYREPLALGLEWLSDRNELGADLVRRDRPLIFRNIQRTGSDADATFGISTANLARVVARSLRPRGEHVEAAPANLEVLEECRSYHLGWLLYAQSLVARGQP